MEVPGVARNYTAHLFSMQAKCYLGDVAETQGRTTMPQQPLCGVRAAGWQKVRLKFLYTCKGVTADEPKQLDVCISIERANPSISNLRKKGCAHGSHEHVTLS